jgi:hypothetical protein
MSAMHRVLFAIAILATTSGANAQTATQPTTTAPPAVAPAAPAAAKPATAAQLQQQIRMKKCAAQWNKLKAANKTGDQTYEAFSKTCLAKK